MWKYFSFLLKDYFFYVNFENESITVVLSDLITSWKETLTIEYLLTRFKEINYFEGNIETDKLRSVFYSDLDPESSEVDKIIKINGDDCNLTLVSKSKDITFSFNLTKNSPEEFFQCITMPFLLIIQEMGLRQEKLHQLLKDKDEEITEYQLEGGKLVRPHLKTPKFSSEDFAEECSKNSELNLLNSLSNIKSLFNGHINSMYSSAAKISQNYEDVKKDAVRASKSCTESINVNMAPQDKKQKVLKWDLGPQNVKRFKNKQAKIKF